MAHCYATSAEARVPRSCLTSRGRRASYTLVVRLTAAVLAQALGENLSTEEVNEMVSEAISNYDGKLYYDGFVKTFISK